MTERDERPTAVVHAERGAQAWRAAEMAQRMTAPDHSDFYALAGELVDTLRAVEALAAVLAQQVAGYAAGRPVYDDSGVIEPRTRLRAGVLALAELRHGVAEGERAVNAFWNAISHIGVEVAS
ncbi:hypothetical protein [Pseudonocardia sp.]|uniref:hypothetical protein n=1 Tax=Pseudonocardia sp. TaxID=60912 RepID=UPI003D0B8923